jgi:3,4-dihydroxy 2-butanone 4-phosphate synthase/GTP cyclohydrolase II
VPIEIVPNQHNQSYLTTKRDKMGHDILQGMKQAATDASAA